MKKYERIEFLRALNRKIGSDLHEAALAAGAPTRQVQFYKGNYLHLARIAIPIYDNKEKVLVGFKAIIKQLKKEDVPVEYGEILEHTKNVELPEHRIYITGTTSQFWRLAAISSALELRLQAKLKARSENPAEHSTTINPKRRRLEVTEAWEPLQSGLGL